MAGRYPKPDAQKINRNATFEWVDLPAEGRAGRPPTLPRWRSWQSQTRKWWSALWAKPQALMWEPDGSTLWTLAVLYDDLVAGRAHPERVSAEIRAHEDRHGLNPKAMLQLRWRIVEAPAAAEASPPPAASRRRLKVVQGL